MGNVDIGQRCEYYDDLCFMIIFIEFNVSMMFIVHKFIEKLHLNERHVWIDNGILIVSHGFLCFICCSITVKLSSIGEMIINS